MNEQLSPNSILSRYRRPQIWHSQLCRNMCRALALVIILLHFGIASGIGNVYATGNAQNIPDQSPTDAQTESQTEARTEADRLLQHAIMLLETESSEEAWEEAAIELQTALQLYRQIERRDLEASAWQQTGQAYNRLRKYDRSLLAFEAAAEIAAEIDDLPRKIKAQTGLGRVYHAIAMLHQQQDDAEQVEAAAQSARTAFESALSDGRSLDAHALVLPILLELAQLNAETERLNEAFAHYQSARELAADDAPLRARINAAQGRILRNQGDHAEAITLLLDAVKFQAQHEEQPSLSTVRLHLDLARSYREQTEWRPAIEQLTRARELLRTHKAAPEFTDETPTADDDPIVDLERTVLTTLAFLYEQIGDEEELAALHIELLAAGGGAEIVESETQRVFKSARLLESDGNLAEAVDQYLRALSLLRQNDATVADESRNSGTPTERDLLTRITALESRLGQCQNVVQHYKDALEIAAEIDADSTKQAYFLSQLGAAYRQLGQLTQSSTAYRSALTLLATNPDLRLQSHVAIQLGTNLRRTGQPEQSLQLFEQGIGLARTVGAIEVEVDARVEMGRAYRNLEQHQDALRLFNRALAQAERLSAAGDSNRLLNTSADQALVAYQTARLEALILHEIGRIHLATADHGAASVQLNRALAAIEFSISKLRAAGQTPTVSELRLQSEILLDLAKASRLQGDYSSADAYLAEVQTVVAQAEVEGDAVACGEGFKQQAYQSQILLEQARIFRTKEAFDEASAAYENAIETSAEATSQAAIWIELGDLQMLMADHAEARVAYEMASSTAQSVLSTAVAITPEDASVVVPAVASAVASTSRSKIVISSAVQQSLDHEQAVQTYVKANARIGLLYTEGGDTDLALYHLNEALSAAQSIDNLALQSDVLTDIGRASAAFVQYDEAHSAFLGALDALRQGEASISGERINEFEFLQANVLIELGKVAQRQEKLDAALDWYQQALTLLDKIGDEERAGAQNLAPDFLRGLLELRGATLERRGNIFRVQNRLEQALRTYRETIAVANKAGNVELEARAAGRAGQIYRDLGRFDQALQIALQIGDLALADQTLISMGQFYRQTEQYEQAQDLFQSALLSAQARGDERQQSNIQMELGRIHRSLAEHEEAIIYYQAALRLTQSAGNLDQASQIRLDLGRIYSQLGDPDEAIATFTSALEDAIHLQDDELTLKIQSDLAQSYRATGDWKEALQTSAAALELAQQTQNVRYQEEALSSLGNTYSKLGRSAEALTMFQQALDAAQSQQNRTQEIRLQLEIGSLYLELARSGTYTKNGNGYESALTHFEEALARSITESDYNSQHAALLKIGQIYERLGRMDDVLATQNQILRLAQVADNVVWEIEALELLGRAYRSEGEDSRAVEPYQQALLLAQELADRKLEQGVLENLASLYRDLGQLDKAVFAYEQILESAALYGDPVLELSALENIGKLQRRTGKTTEAANSFDLLLEMARTADDVATERVALLHLARTRADQGRLDDSLALMQQVLDTVQFTRDEAPSASTAMAAAADEPISPSEQYEEPVLVASTLREMGTLYRYTGQYEQAFNFYADSLVQWRASGPLYSQWQAEEARTLINIGTAYSELGEYRAALKNYAQALQIVQPEYDVSISSFWLTLSLNEQEPHSTEQATAETISILKKIAGTYHAMGNYSAAISVYERGLGLARSHELNPLQVDLLLELGKSQRNRGSYAAVLELNQEALSIHQQHSEVTGGLSDANVDTAVILNKIGNSLDDLQRYEQAIETYAQAVEIANEFEETSLEAQIYTNIGHAYRDSKQVELALENYTEALGYYQSLGDQLSESQTHKYIGQAYLTLRQPQQALGAFQRALRLADDLHAKSVVSQILIDVAKAHEMLEDLTEATRSYARAIDAFPAGPVKPDAYQKIVALLIEGDRANDAFRYVQHAQAQNFLHDQGNPWIDYSPSIQQRQTISATQPLTEETALAESKRSRAASLISQEQTLRRQIMGVRYAQQRIRKQLPNDSVARQNLVLSNRLRNEISRLENEYESIINELQIIQPDYASFFDVDTLGIDEVQQTVLDERTTLIQYFMLKQQTVAWVINQNDSYFIPLDVTYSELSNSVIQLRQMLLSNKGDHDEGSSEDNNSESNSSESTNNETTELFDLSTSLAESIFVPLRPYIETDNVLIIPHDILTYIPFGALWDAEFQQYVIEHYSISYAPSVALLQLAQQNYNTDKSRLLAFGNPQSANPLLASELSTVATRYGTIALSGTAASEARLHQRVTKSDILHLAIPSLLPAEQALFGHFELESTSIPISQTNKLHDQHDGRLGLYELYEMDLTQTNLLVCSACATDVNRNNSGSEILHLQRAAYHAGAPSVIYSLWLVEDDARIKFFDTFYAALQEQLAPTKALRLAQLAMLEDPKTSAPYYWAGFVLAGDYEGAGRSLDTEPQPTPTPEPTPIPTPTPFILPPVWYDEV